jgi:hypothetical protein
MSCQRSVPPRGPRGAARFFTAEAGQVPERAFWGAIERLAGAGARAQITATTVRWRLPARWGQVVAWLEREREEAGR